MISQSSSRCSDDTRRIRWLHRYMAEVKVEVSIGLYLRTTHTQLAWSRAFRSLQIYHIHFVMVSDVLLYAWTRTGGPRLDHNINENLAGHHSAPMWPLDLTPPRTFLITQRAVYGERLVSVRTYDLRTKHSPFSLAIRVSMFPITGPAGNCISTSVRIERSVEDDFLVFV